MDRGVLGPGRGVVAVGEGRHEKAVVDDGRPGRMMGPCGVGGVAVEATEDLTVGD